MKTYPVSALKVIGFTEVPAKQPPLPRVLSAIFWDPESEKVLYPPYRLDGNNLINPVAAEKADFEERADLGEITRFDPQPGKIDCSLWLDDLGDVEYTGIGLISDKLKTISNKHVRSARKQISAKDFSAARTHALIAAAAHPQHPDRLVLRAAAEFCMAKHPGKYPDAQLELQFTEALASKAWHLDTFRKLYQKEANAAIPDSSKLTNATMTRPSTPRCFADLASRELLVA
jgi:hypothetical protein